MIKKIHLLRLRHASGSDSVRKRLKSELEHLATRVANARDSLEKGKPLDEDMIHNAGGIAPLIARYNLLLELGPYIQEVQEDEDE